MNQTNQKLTFRKDERLCSKILIDEIFEKGKKLKTFPFIVTYLKLDSQHQDWKQPVKIVISVPKRKVRLASSRNKLKRRIKEAYRLNKTNFYDTLKTNDTNLALFLVYIGKENETYSYIESKLKVLLTDILKKT